MMLEIDVIQEKIKEKQLKILQFKLNKSNLDYYKNKFPSYAFKIKKIELINDLIKIKLSKYKEYIIKCLVGWKTRCFSITYHNRCSFKK